MQAALRAKRVREGVRNSRWKRASGQLGTVRGSVWGYGVCKAMEKLPVWPRTEEEANAMYPVFQVFTHIAQEVAQFQMQCRISVIDRIVVSASLLIPKSQT